MSWCHLVVMLSNCKNKSKVLKLLMKVQTATIRDIFEARAAGVAFTA